MEGFGFWIFMGLVLAAMIVTGSREKIEKQRTLQRMLEREGDIDEELVNRLLGNQFFTKPGNAYRACRAIGAFVMVASIPMGIIAAMILVSEGSAVTSAALFGAFFGLLPIIGGLGLFVASRFCEKPEQGGAKT